MNQPSLSDSVDANADGNTIEVTVNGKRIECPANCSITDLLKTLSLRGGPIAVEQNLNIVPSDQFETTLLQNDDQFEIVSLTGGG